MVIRGSEVRKRHPLSGKNVKITRGSMKGSVFLVEDWWINVNNGTSWGDSVGNPACLIYGVRSATEGLPFDDEVLYGKVGWAGCLVHVSEISDD